MGEPEPGSGLGCLTTGTLAVLILTIVFLLSGCATGYATIIRDEYNEQGYVRGVYYGEEEYPAVFPATKIATMIEVPRWWGIGSIEKNFVIWPIGATFALLDVPVSILTDVAMLPYDTVNIIRHCTGE